MHSLILALAIVGQQYIDISTIPGVKPNDGTDNSVLVQNAIRAALIHQSPNDLSSPNLRPLVVYTPPGRWQFNTPVFSSDYVTFKGEGESSLWISSPNSSPPLILGIRETEAWKTKAQGGHFPTLPIEFNPDHRIDLYGILDAVTCIQQNQYYGLSQRSASSPSTSADHFIYFWGGPPVYGSWGDWSETQLLNIQFFFERQPQTIAGASGPTPQPILHGPIMGKGCKQDFGGPAPWILQAGDNLFQDNAYHFMFRTIEGQYKQGNVLVSPVREISFGDTTATGPQRVNFQLNLKTCKAQAFINGKQVVVTYGFGTKRSTPLVTTTYTEPTFLPTDNLHFTPDVETPFMLGAAGYNAKYPAYGMTAWNWYGLRITADCPYQDRNTGDPESRIDGRAINDSTRYFDISVDAKSTIALLPLRDKPHEPNRTSDRLILVKHGQAGKSNVSYAFFQPDEGNEINYTPIINNTVQNMKFQSENLNGYALGLGEAMNCKIQDTAIIGGWHGLSGMGRGAYNYKFLNNDYYGQDAAIFLTSSIATIDGNVYHDIARRFGYFNGCSLDIRNIKTANMNGGRPTKCIFEFPGTINYGFRINIDGLSLDTELTPGPSDAIIICGRHPTTLGTMLSISHVDSGMMPKGVPVVKLIDTFNPVDGPGKIYMKDVIPNTVGVQVNGPGWEGTIEDIFTRNSWQWVNYTGDGFTNIVAKERRDALPTSGTYTAYGNYIEIRHPLPGQPAAYICTQSGTFGPVAADGTSPNPVFTPIK